MSKRINELLNIKHVSGPYIYTKDNYKKVIFEIIQIPSKEESFTFNSLISSIETPITMFYIKRKLNISTFKDYFDILMQMNSNKSFLPEALSYINALKDNIPSLNSCSLFLIFQLDTTFPDENTIISILDKLDITFNLLRDNEILTLIEEAFDE